MDYIDQLNAFGAKSAGILSPGATALYVRLFLLNNAHNWAEYFPATLSMLQLATGTGSINTIRTWQKELEDKGFIICKRGGHKKPNLYNLPQLYVSKNDRYKCNVSMIDIKTDTNIDTYVDTKTDTKTDSIKDIDIDIERESKKKSAAHSKKAKPFSPPSLEEVCAYIQDKALQVDGKRFFDYYDANDWRDRDNKPVRSWKQKCITWDRHNDGSSYQRNQSAPVTESTRKIVMGGI